MSNDYVADGSSLTSAKLLSDVSALLERFTGRRLIEDSDRPPARRDRESGEEQDAETLALPPGAPPGDD